MLICPDYKFIYIHIHKNAGKAVKHCLRGILKKSGVRFFTREWNGNEIHNHVSLPALLDSYPDLKGYFTFTTIRNPWDRLASAFFWVKSKPEGAPGMNRAHLSWAPDFSSFVKALYKSYLQYRDKRPEDNIFLQTERSFVLPRLVYPAQSVYLYNVAKNIAPHAICHYENLEEDLKRTVGKLLGEKAAQGVKLKILGPSAKPPYRTLYTPETADMVREIYAEDIKRFSYEF
ncbi:sulfotransferase family protein [Geothermobacter ehrlichii]|uniref:Sulfotransferase family protein n=1 Tax=Geothermobacter ehrlichii TaxID=213224 RepID=A0A5D3WP08_9BACT|nr:sulfotransferase family 2 domain-containing protein [Geothermobacter ehrlichii]TYP00074.1 sulfotransferase family protein [Geothermobacter ehrlichii]